MIILEKKVEYFAENLNNSVFTHFNRTGYGGEMPTTNIANDEHL